MLFNTAIFGACFVVFYLLYFARENRSYKLWLITIASALFYATWSYKFLPILFGTGLIDFYIAQAIHRSADERHRKLLLICTVTLNLSVLAFFKYTNFFLTTVQDGLHLFGSSSTLPLLDLVVPLGISFYTFQSISYTVDVYRKTFVPKTRFLEFMASLTFFPHLPAGPIIRATFLLPQFDKLRGPGWDAVKTAFLLIAAGLFKKSVADLLAPMANELFAEGVAEHSALASWTGVLAFTGQIYGDFSGYTDLATGLALLLGFKFPKNFDLPYLATGPADFWRRWHISLSTWLRDYCYMPMVLRNRRLFLSLFLTMTLCGLWHGARWTFVVFGMYHGALLVADGYLSSKLKRTRFAKIPPLPKILFTFYLVAVGLIFFRAPSLTAAANVIANMHWPAIPSELRFADALLLVLTILAIVVCHALDYFIVRKPTVVKHRYVLWPMVAVLIALSILLGTKGTPFIYFQF